MCIVYRNYSSCLIMPNSRRRKRVWKSKHKNVVDPVFLGELEHLMQDLACCQLEHKISPDLWPDR